jgi:hypothetical protein
MDPTSELRERDALLERISAYVDKHGIGNVTLEMLAKTLRWTRMPFARCGIST